MNIYMTYSLVELPERRAIGMREKVLNGHLTAVHRTTNTYIQPWIELTEHLALEKRVMCGIRHRNLIKVNCSGGWNGF